MQAVGSEKGGGNSDIDMKLELLETLLMEELLQQRHNDDVTHEDKRDYGWVLYSKFFILQISVYTMYLYIYMYMYRESQLLEKKLFSIPFD